MQREFPQAFAAIPAAVWRTDWVADLQPIGSREPAVKHLAAYVYRTGFSAEWILAHGGHTITLVYRDDQTGAMRRMRLPAQRFPHHLLQHILPHGFQWVRSFGWLAPAAKTRGQRIRALLDCKQPLLVLPGPIPPPLCPCCQKPMVLVGQLPRPPP